LCYNYKSKKDKGRRVLKKNKKLKLIIILSLIFILLLLICVDLYLSNSTFSSSYYTVKSDKIESSFRIVQLSDLHGKEYGENNEKLIAEIEKAKPDLIVTTGDMLDGYSEKTESVSILLKKLSKIAPLYSSCGNHELMHDEKSLSKSKDVYEENGAILLEESFTEIEINGQKIRLGGIYGYCLPEIYYKNNPEHQKVADFIRTYQETELFTVLLCHMPVCFIENGGLDYWDIDLVFSGHAHGGQLRIPFIGGLIAPDQGYFPGKVSGLYFSEDNNKCLVLSRGLGSSENIPRFNNIPELVITDVVPK